MQPILKQLKKLQQPTVSELDNCYLTPFDIHNLSLKASVVPNAQHEPQFAWSLTLSITLTQSGHWVLESNVCGRSICIFDTLLNSSSLIYNSLSTTVPKISFTSSIVAFSNLVFLPAFHIFWTVLTWFIISSLVAGE